MTSRLSREYRGKRSQSRGYKERSRDESNLPSDEDDVFVKLESVRAKRARRLDVSLPKLTAVRINSSQENEENEGLSDSGYGPVTISTPKGFPYFSSILLQHGYYISTKKNEMIVDASMFRKKLSDWCTMTIRDNPQNMKTFVAEMKKYLSKNEYFMIAMSPTLDTDNVYQLSLVQNLLGIEPLQGEMFEVLLQKLIKAAHTDDDDEDVEFLNQLMNQMKWIPCFSNEQEFVKEILEIMETARGKAQKTMIRTILDVISPQFHNLVAKTLLKLLKNFSPFSATILETFSLIDMSDDDLSGVREIAVENMSMIKAKDLPAFFAFLFSFHDPNILGEILSDMREKVNYTLGPGKEKLTTTRKLVDKIQFCISTNEQIVPMWTKLTKKDFKNDPELFLTVDLTMFLIFLESNNKLIEPPLKQLFAHDKITLNLFDEVINTFPAIIDLIFEPLSKFLEKILWSKETKLHAVVANILARLFSITRDHNARQIVVIFTSVLARGKNRSRDSAIEGLTLMATQSVAKLLKFISLVMGIMDHVIKFLPNHISSIMKVLAAAAFIPNNRESTHFEVEFSILLKKQLTHNSLPINCVGVIGSVATIDQLILQEAEPTKISNLLETTWRAVERHGEPCFIFFDQLSDVLESSRRLPLEISKELKDMLQDKFLENWFIFGEDVHNANLSTGLLKMQPVMNRNEELEDDDATLKFEDSPVGMNSLVLPAHLRLLSLLSGQLNDGDLGNIDMLLGVALLLPKFELYERDADSCPEDQKLDLARCLILAINFLREVCNAFSLQLDPVLVTKLWSRLVDLATLHQLLENFVNKLKPRLQFLPLACTTDIMTKFSQINVLEDFGDMIHPETLNPYFRRFHRNVFRMLDSDLELKLCDIDYNKLVVDLDNGGDHKSILKKVKVLNLDMLLLLLRDLNMQVEASHLYIIKDVAWDFPSDLFDRLCHHMDVLLEASKKLQTGLESKVEDCFLYLYKTMINYLNEAKTAQYIGLYEKALNTLETRAGESIFDKEGKISNYLYRNPESIGTPDTAVQHLLVMQIVYDMGDTNLKSAMRSNISRAIDFYLRRDWNISSLLVQTMLEILFSTTENSLNSILCLAKSIISINPSKDLPSKQPYRSCTCVNFSAWYKILFENLVHHVSKEMEKMNTDDSDLWTRTWLRAVEIFNILVNVSVRKKNHDILATLLRYSCSFLEVWSNSQYGGIKLLIWLWKNKQEVAAQELKNLQTTTRKIHSVCDHAKMEHSSQLLLYVPMMKKVLEELVFRVRQQLISNGATANAFMVGVLKHKSIDGGTIDSDLEEDVVMESDQEQGEISSDSSD